MKERPPHRWYFVVGLPVCVAVLWALYYLWLQQSVGAVIDTDGVTLTPTAIARSAERRFFEGLGAHDSSEVQIQSAPVGLEFAQLTLAVRWRPDRQALTCNDDNAPPFIHASEYVLVDSEGWRAEGLEVSFEGLMEPCHTLTVLFQPSRARAVYTELLFRGRRATLREVPGATIQRSGG